jgi:predicted RNA-binding protein with PUA-like domain
MNTFLIKSEPSTYSIEDLKREKVTAWTGIRNFQARNTLKTMKKGDQCLFYHSGEGKAVVGLAKVVKESYPDPTSKEGDWVAVDVKFVKSFARPITLKEVKARPKLKSMQLVTHSRLSVQVVTSDQLDDLLSILR